MPQDGGDVLRRSKRNKFHLDVATMHLAHPERRRTIPGRLATDDGKRPSSISPAPPVLSPQGASSEPSSVDAIGRRRKMLKVDVDSDEDMMHESPSSSSSHQTFPSPNLSSTISPVTGVRERLRRFVCEKCPARFDSRVALASHSEMHLGKRRLSCERCDYSVGSANAIKVHRRMHEEEDRRAAAANSAPEEMDAAPKLEAEVADSEGNGANTSADSTAPTLIPALAVPLTINIDEPNEPISSATSAPEKTPAAASSPSCRFSCGECPFASRDQDRLDRHKSGHLRSTGFQCPFCSFKSESAGFLKRHVLIHSEQKFDWPPRYVGVSPRRAYRADDADGPPKLSRIDSSLTPTFSLTAPTPSKARISALPRFCRPLGGLFACPHPGCAFKTRLVSSIVCHKATKHPLKKKMGAGLACPLCGVRVAGAIGRLHVHLILKHKKKLRSQGALSFFIGEIIGEKFVRAPVIVKEEEKEEILVQEGKEDGEEKETEEKEAEEKDGNEDKEDEEEEKKKEGVEQEIDFPPGITEDEAVILIMKKGTFQCQDCPYSANIRSRLDRHGAKHIVKGEHQCPFCSFSCRGQDLIATHEKLHKEEESARLRFRRFRDGPPVLTIEDAPVNDSPKHNKVNADLPPVLTKEIGEENEERKGKGKKKRNGDDTPGDSPGPSKRMKIERIRGSDGALRVRCDECPYTTKHHCDLRAHKAMHIGVRQHKCSECTYSTKRPVSLQVHLLLHQHSPTVPKNPKKQLPSRPVRVGVHGEIGSRVGSGRSREYRCLHCPFTCSSCSSLWSHARRHIFRGPLRCPSCSFSTVDQKSVDEHKELHAASPSDLLSMRGADGQFKCRECPFTSDSYSKFYHHRQAHEKRSKFSCTQCSFCGVSASSLAEHFLLHSNSGPNSPFASSNENSNSSFCENGRGRREKASSFDLAASKRLMKPPPVVEKMLKSAAELNATPIVCPECPFSDPNELLFSLHRQLHSGPKRTFECNVCSYSAFSAEALHRHISLHLPPLSPNSAASSRRNRATNRRRVSAEIIPPGVEHLACSQCLYKTVDSALFHQHRIEHAQTIQQRLVTQIKRAATSFEEAPTKKKARIKEMTKKNEKGFICDVCSFKCDSVACSLRHKQFHGSLAPFRCTLCDYASDTHQVTEYHILNHHLDRPLAHLTKAAILNPSSSSLAIESTVEDRVRLAGQEYSCTICEFHTLELRQLSAHWEEEHGHRGDETSTGLSLGVFPVNSILTTA